PSPTSDTPVFPRLSRRGPIEAEPTATPWGWCTGFHGYPAVAPLKPGELRVLDRGVLGFHGYPAVAPLKLLAGVRGLRPRDRFHGYPAVAPLKPSIPGLRRRRGLGFHGYPAVAPLKRGPVL